MGTIKVKAWDPEQGDHVTIDEENFDPSFMVRLEEEPKPKPPYGTAPRSKYEDYSIAELKVTLENRGVKPESYWRKSDFVVALAADDAKRGG